MTPKRNNILLFVTTSLVLLTLILVGFRPADSAAAQRAQMAYLPLLFRNHERTNSTPTPTDAATPTPTATNTPTQTPTPTATDPDTSSWLSYINYLRSLGSLAAVTENTDWSDGCVLHSRYMVKNDTITHYEDESNPWYTDEGAEAGRKGNVMVSSSVNASEENAINLWISGPFHGVGILDPQLAQTGFGIYHENVGTWKTGATLDVLRGLDYNEPPAGTYPVMWPGDGQTTPILSYGGSESPDPLTSCSGYSAPSGPPIYLQIGSGGQTPSVTSTSFRQGTTNLAHCVFDETNYVNPNSSHQSLGRSVLGSRDAIIVMPQQPLTPGNAYTVSITTNGTTYSWSFTASSIAQLQTSSVDALIEPPNK